MEINIINVPSDFKLQLLKSKLTLNEIKNIDILIIFLHQTYLKRLLNKNNENYIYEEKKGYTTDILSSLEILLKFYLINLKNEKFDMECFKLFNLKGYEETLLNLINEQVKFIEVFNLKKRNKSLIIDINEIKKTNKLQEKKLEKCFVFKFRTDYYIKTHTDEIINLQEEIYFKHFNLNEQFNLNKLFDFFELLKLNQIYISKEIKIINNNKNFKLIRV